MKLVTEKNHILPDWPTGQQKTHKRVIPPVRLTSCPLKILAIEKHQASEAGGPADLPIG